MQYQFNNLISQGIVAMKCVAGIILFLFFSHQLFAQSINTDSLYNESMKKYQNGNYQKAAEDFDKIIKVKGYELSNLTLYNGACTYSLNGNVRQSMEILQFLAEKRTYSNIDHISKDTDLVKLHDLPEWKTLMEKVKENLKKLQEKARKSIPVELFKARDILLKDNGKLWGKNIWSEDLLVLDKENGVYSLQQLPGSKLIDLPLYYLKVPDNILSQTNSVQEYNGKSYAVVMTSNPYLKDSSSTLIHELFHLLQNKIITLNGTQIAYLDNYDAREWLRLEFQALRNALKSIDMKDNISTIETYINDAIQYRKLRQNKYKEYLKNEIEIETCEGLANYTGFVLSSYPNKYQKVINEITSREEASTYTRPFPYATGPAYGLIFDYLGIDWRIGLDKVYNFLDIYETKYLKKKMIYDDNSIAEANKRNNYDKIHNEELARKNKNEEIIKYYTDIFIIKPTLSVVLTDTKYSQSSDMNGTIILQDIGIVYSSIKGVDITKTTFGNFTTIQGKEKLGVSGVLGSFKRAEYIFPMPLKIEGKKITGEYYEIDLNDGWEVVKVNEKGDLQIVKKK